MDTSCDNYFGDYRNGFRGNAGYTKIIFTIIVIAIALYVIYEFIWDNLILVTLIKLCAVAVVVLVAIKIIKLIFSK